MSNRAASHTDISIGDVQHSQLVVGDHNTIHTPDGTEVTVLQVGERPVPRLRPLPVSGRPSAAEIFGRKEELALVAASTAQAPIQLYAPDGAGKTSVLKLAALRAPAPSEGLVFESARHRSVDEIQASLYAAFWECDVPFIPAPSEFDEFLADREALLILDDCALDRSDLETLLDRVPHCTVVLASQARTLWSRGTARRLVDLDPVAAVGLLERELGRPLEPDERKAAETIVSKLGGNPQSLVETAALVEDGQGSLRELADDPAALERRFDPSALTESQKRILEILSALDGASLGGEHISAIAGMSDAGKALRELERRGWVKAGSPRYRSTRPLPQGAGSPPREKLAMALLGHLTAWSRRAKPPAVAEEAEAIEGALELGAAKEQWDEALALALAAEGGLMVAGAWSSCRRVLQSGLRAAAALGDESARAYVLHQLGSQSLCLGDRTEAADQLSEALRIRELLGERKGAELTRHNLKQLRGGGDESGENGGGGSGGPPRPRAGLALALLAVVVAGIVAALLLAGGDGKNTAGPIIPPSGARPAITIERPEHREAFHEGDDPLASFDCVAAEDTKLESCEGTLDGTPIRDGDPLEMSTGEHRLLVTALDKDGRESRKEVSYSVEPPQRSRADETPPTITIVAPADGAAYMLGESVAAEYFCEDEESEPVTCSGPVGPRAVIDTATEGRKEFVVTGIDSVGNEDTETAEYEVISPEGKELPPEEVR